MQLLRYPLLLLVLLVLHACQNPDDQPYALPQQAVKQLQEFKSKPKYTRNYFITYEGIKDQELRQEMEQLINLSADEFIHVAEHNPSPESFRKKVEIGLTRFTPYYQQLDSEDRQRTGYYYEELMEIAGLPAPRHLLDSWLENDSL